jgi:hypothetical protein
LESLLKEIKLAKFFGNAYVTAAQKRISHQLIWLLLIVADVPDGVGELPVKTY